MFLIETWKVRHAKARLGREGLWVPDLYWAMADAGRKVGGYNGVYFDGDAPSGVDLDPDWPMDDPAWGF